MRFVDAAAHRRHDLIDDAQKVRLVLEAHASWFEHPLPLDIDTFVAVYEDVVDGLILEQRFERAQTRHFIENFRDEIIELLCV